MSLLSTATTWTIEDNHVSKKRIPQIRKTAKHFKSSTESSSLGHPPPSTSSSGNSSIFHSGPENFSPGTNAVTYDAPTLEDAAQKLDERNKRVHELLNHITAVNGINAGSSLADFNPPTYPEHSQTKKIGDATTREEFMSPAILSPSEIPDHSNELQHPIPQIHHSGGEEEVGATSVYAYREDKPLSNYRNVYAEKPLYHKQQGMEGFLNYQPHPNHDKDVQRMQEKINYMIRILEDLKVEKTENITEEFIMFSMLGVFVIFIVDSFSKSAKYVR
jgi:hypothetical protein